MSGPLTERPLSREDVTAYADLHRRFEQAFFGTPETGDAEAAEMLDIVDDLAADSLALDRDGRLVGAVTLLGGASGRAEAGAAVDPGDPAATTAWERIAAWAGARAESLEILSQDGRGMAAARTAGWTVDVRSFDLERDPGALPAPEWPAGVTAGSADLAVDGREIHDLVYRRSAWASVAGHHDRPYEEWYRLVSQGSNRWDLSVLARHEGRAVGLASSALFSDGFGYIHQLAVDREHRRRGIGRALLIEAFGRLSAAGASRLGLNVQAGNRRALALYESLGLAVTREWIRYRGPTGGGHSQAGDEAPGQGPHT
jgi:ribosomal protein S18 acetylase RimI-like enzyme